MTRRGWKYLALVVAGGTLFQAAGCAQMLVDTVVYNLVPLLVSQLLQTGLQTTTP